MVFKPEARRPAVKPGTSSNYPKAMVSVIQDRRGTAWWRLRGYNIPNVAKTGPPKSGDGAPHAWFAGYTMAKKIRGFPDFASAVILGTRRGKGSRISRGPVSAIGIFIYGSRNLYWVGKQIGCPKGPPRLGVPTQRTPGTLLGKKTLSGGWCQIGHRVVKRWAPPRVGGHHMWGKISLEELGGATKRGGTGDFARRRGGINPQEGVEKSSWRQTL